MQYPLKLIDTLDYDLLRLGKMQRWFRSNLWGFDGIKKLTRQYSFVE
jgi:hypothetical protein